MFKHLYAPFLMKRWVRPLVVVLFFGWFCSSMAVMPSVEVGLDQEITMPDESFVLKYFEFLKVYNYTYKYKDDLKGGHLVVWI